MERCGLLSVDEEAFYGLVSLKYLQLNYGHLIHPLSLQYIEKTLVRLDLKYNSITYINATYFNGCYKLFFIDLQGNKLSVASNIDHIAHYLISISLSMNQINGVLAYFTKSFPNLTSLNLDDNHKDYFCMEQTRHLPSLKFLNLGRNNFTRINVEFIMELKTTLLLMLANNPMKCENIIGLQNSCNLVHDDENRLLCGDVVDISY